MLHRHNLPFHVCKALLPRYERMSDKKILERCQRGKTQNNKSTKRMVEKDTRRTTASIRKRATTENVQRALKKRGCQLSSGLRSWCLLDLDRCYQSR
ncbi:hypothetical protein HPB47_018975 [Ixodes persulcatus]|uniref:Uncharacterized protein n=1 Tax=Ixodes persulcatus TaxID=34615 RepID=A0AC60QN14_IXOPE|nr:hypothetical protein HPB47_018975 [Ixodes persulcatus]